MLCSLLVKAAVAETRWWRLRKALKGKGPGKLILVAADWRLSPFAHLQTAAVRLSGPETRWGDFVMEGRVLGKFSLHISQQC